MAARSGMLAAAAAALLLSGMFPATAQETPPAHDLKKLRVDDKVQAVLWTRRSDGYTLQVVFPRSSRVLDPRQQDPGRGGPLLAYPDVRVWLLKEDGSLIEPTRRLGVAPTTQAAVVARGADDRIVRMEVLYHFPLSAGTEAVAVAVKVDGEYRIEPIIPLGS